MFFAFCLFNGFQDLNILPIEVAPTACTSQQASSHSLHSLRRETWFGSSLFMWVIDTQISVSPLCASSYSVAAVRAGP